MKSRASLLRASHECHMWRTQRSNMERPSSRTTSAKPMAVHLAGAGLCVQCMARGAKLREPLSDARRVRGCNLQASPKPLNFVSGAGHTLRRCPTESAGGTTIATRLGSLVGALTNDRFTCDGCSATEPQSRLPLGISQARRGYYAVGFYPCRCRLELPGSLRWD